MNREIKFRVWDKEKKKLLDVLEIDWIPLKDENVEVVEADK